MTDQQARRALYSDLFDGEEREHTPDCAYCPFCTGIGALRSMNPEVMDHVAAALRELTIATALFLEHASDQIGPQRPGEGRAQPERDGGGRAKVRHIDKG